MQIHLKMQILCRNKSQKWSMLSQKWKKTQQLLKLQWSSFSMSRIMQESAESQKVCNSCIQQLIYMLCCEHRIKNKEWFQLRLNYYFNHQQKKNYLNKHHRKFSHAHHSTRRLQIQHNKHLLLIIWKLQSCKWQLSDSSSSENSRLIRWTHSSRWSQFSSQKLRKQSDQQKAQDDSRSA